VVTSVCAACGNHFPDPRPGVCVVCADERQWLPPGGQRWTTLAELAAAGHASDVREVEPGLTGIGADPPVAIGQRSLLVTTSAGNVLWDPSGFIDDAAVAAVRAAGGLSFVTASHPHFYGAIAERTENIRIGHGVRLLPFPYNHPVRAAEAADEAPPPALH